MQDDLATLVGSRICHDLISPIGAIGNGVELLQLTGGDSGTEIALISDSVENANARIRFFRVAFGATSTDQRISRNDVLSILSASARGGRITYFWQAEGDHSRADVQVAFLLLLCCESAMPQGGDITVRQTGERWEIAASGPRLAVEEPLWTMLNDPRSATKCSAAQVQFALLPAVLAASGRTLDIALSDSEIKAVF